MKLFEALQLTEKEIISFVCAGGKTSIIRAMAKEAAELKRKTIITTTTKIHYQQISGIKVVVCDNPEILAKRLYHAFANYEVVMAAGRAVTENKLIGLDRELFNALHLSGAELIFVEADGAAGKPFKAPAAHEPVIPQATTMVIPVVGIDCLYQPLNTENVHRPEIVEKLARIAMGDMVTPTIVAAVLTSCNGYFKRVPPKAQWIPFINKVETKQQLAMANKIAIEIKKQKQAKILIGAAYNDNMPVREICV